MKRLALVLLLLAGCKSGLATDEGHPYKCNFDQASADQCAEGWACAVDGTCHPKVSDPLPSTRPTFETNPPLIYPAELTSGIRFIAAGTTQNNKVPITVITEQNRVLFALRDDVVAPSVNGTPVQFNVPPDLSDLAFSEATAATIAGTNVTVINPYAVNDSQNVSLVAGFPQALRAAVSPDPSALNDPLYYLLRRGDNAGEIEVARSNPTDIKSPLTPARFRPFLPTGLDGGSDVLDARAVPRGELEYLNQFSGCPGAVGSDMLPVVVTRDGAYYRHCKGATAVNDTWALLTPAADPLSLPIAPGFSNGSLPLLRVDRTHTLYAFAFRTPDQPPSLDIIPALAVLKLQKSPVTAPLLTRTWTDCHPCSSGDRIVDIAPGFTNGQPHVDVLCERGAKDGGSLTVRRVVGAGGSGATDPCEFETVTPSMDLSELYSEGGGNSRRYAISTATSDGILLGGKHGQVWRGDSFDTLTPLYLDRVPDQISMLFGRPFALSRDFVALPSDAGTFTVLLPKELTGSNKDEPIFPRSAPTDLNDSLQGWVVLSTSDLAKIIPDAGSGRLELNATYGSQLLDSAGNPAPEPYFMEAADYDQDQATGGLTRHFVVAAFDSVYESSRQTVDEPRQLPALTPELTPQPGAAIRSMTLDRSVRDAGTNDPYFGERGPLISGYLIASKTLYAFRKDTKRWSQNEVFAAPGEPMEVWMKSPTESLGRVGFRDGQVLSLPEGFQLVKPLQGARAVDFANLGGVPVLLATNGIYVATDEQEGSTLIWKAQPLPPELASVNDGGTNTDLANAKLFIAPEAAADVLYLFTDHGFVYRLASVARQ